MAPNASEAVATQNALYEAQAKMELLNQLTLLEEILGDLQAENIELPGIVVCGDQSAGKDASEVSY